MQVVVMQPDKQWSILATLEVDGRYLIELSSTVFGGIRVTLRKVNDLGLKCNWCAGKEPFHVFMLVNTMLEIINRDDDADGLPFCSNIKPYFNDPDFSNFVYRNFKMHIKDYKDMLEVGKVITLIPYVEQEPIPFN